MNATTTVLTGLLAAALLTGGLAKLVGLRTMRRDAQRLALSYPAYRLIGLSELAAAAGLLLGLYWWPVAVAAASGLTALMAGAAIAHRRAGDPPGKTAAPLVVAALAIAAAIARSAA